ncbi:oligosaccharide flippase family protein [bacterium]|nr:oligosaccharide flippase family protein [bacterium]
MIRDKIRKINPSHDADIKKAAIRSGKAMVYGKILNQAISFGVVWIQAHYLPVWAYGVFGLFIGTVTYVNTLSNAGTGEIARRFIPEFTEKGEIEAIGRTVRGLVLIRFIFCALFLGIIVLLFDYLGPLLKIADYKSLFIFYSFGIIFTLECFLLFGVYWALLRQPFYMIIFTVHNLFRLVAFYYVLSRGGGLVGALAVDAISYFFLFIALYLPFINEFDIKSFSFSNLPIKRMFRYGIYMYSSNLGFIFFSTSTDLYVISALLDKHELGLYAFAATLGQAIMKWMPDRLIGSIIETAIYREFARKGDTEKLQLYFSKVLTLQTFFVVPTAIFVVIFASPIIENVFDSKFLPSSAICGGLAVVFAIAAFKYPLTLVATSLEKTRLLFFSQTVFAVYNLIADIVLIPILGLWGAVIATGSSFLFMIISIWITLGRLVRLPVEGIALFKILVNSSIMGVYLYYLSDKISSIFGLIAAIISAGVIYLLISYFNCPVDKELRKKLLSSLFKKGSS